MRWILYGIVIGVLLGVVLHIPIPPRYVRYTAVAIVGILDAIFGAARAELYGPIHDDTDRRYDFMIFISGLIFNVLLAIGITWLGDRLGIDLYLAAIIAFTIRIFKNLGFIRRVIVDRVMNR